MKLKPENLWIGQVIFSQKDSFEGILTCMLFEDTNVGLGMGKRQANLYKDVNTDDYYAIPINFAKATKLTNRIKDENVLVYGLLRITDLIYEYDDIINNIEDKEVKDIIKRALTLLHLQFSDKNVDRSIVKELEPVILYLYNHIDDYDDLDRPRSL